MEDIAFSDWPGQPLDLSGSNPWLPAYGFQPPSTLLDKDDFLGNPDAHLFLNGTAGQHYVYLETIQEETSDDLRSESDVSESRTSPVGWLATDSESGSVIRIENIEDIDSGSEREIACPSKRRRQENLLNISDDESNQSLSRSSSLIQFESLEKQCQDVSSSSPNIFSAFSFDSLENQRKNDELERRNYMEVERGSDYYKTFKIDVPSKATRQLSSDSLLYNATRFSGSDSSESSEDTLDATKYNTSVNNLKTWKSFDGLHVNNNVLKASSKVSVENLSEDSGYGDNFCQFAKLKSSSIPNIAMSSQNVKAEKPSRKRPSDYLEKYRLKNCNGFEAYDGEIFQNFTTNFGASYQDLSIFDRYEKIDGGFVRNSSAAAAAARRRNKSDLFTIFRADVLNIEKASECVRASKFNVQTTSEPNLLRAISYSTSVGGDNTAVTNSLFDQVGYFGNCVYVSSVPKDLNLAENINIWNAASCFVTTGGDAVPSIAAKNWDLIDLSDATTQNQSMSSSKVSVKSLKKKKKNAAAAVKKQESPLASSESDTDVSFKREGSYMEAMANMIDMSDDEFNPCYRDKTKRSTILEFDKIVLKAISETSIQSLGTSRDKMDMLFTSTPIFSQNRNVKSTPNLAIFNNKNEDEDGEPQNKQQRNSLSELPRKSSLISRSRSTSRISSEVEEKQTATTPTKSLNGSTSSKGVHFCPVVAEVNWQVRDSIDRDSQSLSSTPDLTPKRQSPPPPPIMRPEPRLPEKRAYVSQPDLQTGGEVEEEIDKFAFALLKPRQSISQPNVMIHRRRSDIREDPDGSLVTNYMDTDGVTYKHTHIGDVYKSTPTTTGRHVPGTSKQKEVKAEKPVPAMEPVVSHRASKSSSKTGKLGGFFSRIASFKFPSRKSGGEDKGNKHNKKKSLEASKNKDNAIAGQRLATKEDYIYIPLKGPPIGPCNNNEAVDNNKSVLQVDGRADENACLSAKPPLPKLPPRVVGASVKKRPEAIAQLPAPERRTIDSGDALPRPMEPMGLIETDLDTEVTVITSGAHVKTRSLMNLGAEAPPRSLAAPPHPSRPHKSMEFLLDKQNLKVVEPPENELQKGERIMSEHELRIQRSLQKLTVPDWYKQAEVPREGFILKKPVACRESRWSGTTGSKTTSLSSLGSNSQSPVVLSPTPQNQPFVRWSTSKLNSTASSPCASTRSSFNARQPNGSISPSSLRSSFNYRQPYLGWRSQERLTRPRTPAERLANTLINQSQQQESPEIQTSIKEVTSAIVHYVSGLKPEDGGGRDHSYDSQETASQRSMSVSPRGSQKLCWLESSFVGTRPLDSPQTPVTLTESQTSSPAPPSSLRLDLHTHNDSSDGTRQQIIQQVSPDSQSNRMEHASHLPSDFMSGSDSAKTKVPFISVADVSNGVIKKSTNKMSKSNKKKLSMSAGRGRPRKALVATYHSQISGDKNTIKIRIKKNSMTTQVQLTPNKKKSGRRKRNKNPSDTDASDYDTPSKRIKVSADAENSLKEEEHEPQDQSGWGNDIPEKVLHKIFQNACLQEGSLPILVRLCRVCKLWRNVALTPSLWQRVDLNWVREKFRIDQRLHWLIENRLSNCQDLNLGIWEVRNIQLALESLVGHCPNLRGLNLSGWKGLNADNLKYLTTECKNLERLDLSSINSSSAINAQPLVTLTQTMSGRLTHLVLAHNKLAGFTQIMAALAGNCPNLQLLDISNIGTSHNSALLHVEKLQSGCPKLKVLRITNSQIWLAPASLPDQVASPGFPLLEELSLAGIEDDQTTTARSVDDDGIERILKNSTKLRLLDVRGCNRLTDSGLVKVPAWDLEHLFLSACYVTRTQNAGLELIVQKWSHSLLEVDLAWSTATASLDAAVFALAEKGLESPLRILNLCGSSVSLEPVKAVLTKCPNLHSINLQSCRALPRGIKRLFSGSAVDELRQTLQGKPKTEVNESDTEQPSPEQGSVQ